MSERRMCSLLGVNRSTIWRQKTKQAKVVSLEEEEQKKELKTEVHGIIKRFPTWGYRRVHAWLKNHEGMCINRKKVHRLIKENGWQVNKINTSPRPRVQQSASRASEPNERWAMDATSAYCEEGWIGIMAVIDCCTREIVGLHVSERGRAIEAEIAIEQACLSKFGLIYGSSKTRPVLRSDNGKVFTSARFQGRCGQYGLEQEFITPYTPQQNGMIERFFRSLKEECIWLHNFKTVEEAKTAIEEWVKFYNEERPHQALNYLTPSQIDRWFHLYDLVA